LDRSDERTALSDERIALKHREVWPSHPPALEHDWAGRSQPENVRGRRHLSCHRLLGLGG